MNRIDSKRTPRALPPAHAELARRLEEAGIAAWSQGEGLLEDLAPAPAQPLPDSAPFAPYERRKPTRVLLCAADGTAVLRALPQAVVTASDARRLTHGTSDGPIDLLPLGAHPIEEALLGFGLNVFGFAFRPATGSECDPASARASLARGELDVLRSEPNPFAEAPRRYWIAARLLSEYALEPSELLLASARAALVPNLERLPEGAPARRELERVLATPHPLPGLAFLRMTGLDRALFPGMKSGSAELVDALPPIPGLRWAAWLAGGPTGSTLRRLRVPHALTRRIERMLRYHPIDRVAAEYGEAGVRRILGRLDPDEIEGLFAWRRVEIERMKDAEAAARATRQLDALPAQLDAIRAQAARSDRVRSLALDGQAVMTILDCGPGRHIGQALAHLASHVEEHPDDNERAALEALLHTWAERHLEIKT